jgi:dihydrofolate reductase
LGRRTYDEFAAYWADKTGADDTFADHINRTPKLVVSTTLTSVEWQNTSLLSDGIFDDLRARKHQPGKDISITGSGTLIRSLMAEGLVDQLALLVFPIVLGAGRRLFDGWRRPLPLQLVKSQTLANGVLALVYQTTPDQPTEPLDILH